MRRALISNFFMRWKENDVLDLKPFQMDVHLMQYLVNSCTFCVIIWGLDIPSSKINTIRAKKALKYLVDFKSVSVFVQIYVDALIMRLGYGFQALFNSTYS